MREDEANIGESIKCARDDEARCRSRGLEGKFEHGGGHEVCESVRRVVRVDKDNRLAPIERREKRREVLVTQIPTVVAREDDEAVRLEIIEAIGNLAEACIDVGERQA